MKKMHPQISGDFIVVKHRDDDSDSDDERFFGLYGVFIHSGVNVF